MVWLHQCGFGGLAEWDGDTIGGVGYCMGVGMTTQGDVGLSDRMELNLLPGLECVLQHHALSAAALTASN